MKTSASLMAATAGLLSAVAAQRPTNTSICDYYTTALLKENTAANQQTLLTLVVNTAVIGNYTTPNVGIKVNGILNPGMVNGTAVNLLPYFDGGFASTNEGGSSGVSVNFLDDGGAAPLKMNKPANGTTSRQYMLLTHLYQYFGALLGCSATGFPSYQGDASQYSVHKYMDLDYAEVTYFIEQVGLSAASFGVADADVQIVGGALSKYFNVKCAPATTIIPAQGAQLQSVCIAEDCPLAPNNTCAAYAAASSPAIAVSSLVPTETAATSTSKSSATSSTKPSASSFTGAADKASFGWGAGLLAAGAMLL